MARKLTANVLVLDKEGNPTVLEAGTEVPAEYADQVGDHCFEAEPDDKSTGSRTRRRSSE